MKSTIAIAAGAAVLLLAGTASQPARAAIHCEGPSQVVNGSLITTPYCEDNYLAYVARRFYGIQVSDYTIRQNPSAKAEVCQQIGHDNRVNNNCQGHLPGGDQRRR